MDIHVRFGHARRYHQSTRRPRPCRQRRDGDRVTLTYTVTNPSNDPLSAVSLTDPACSPIGGFVETAGNGDGYLDPGEVWTYSCTFTAATPGTITRDRKSVV